uniref:protein-tyrosine-phosphatase n=1 Tax=Steinernema glaseri TaxID=37863 RepID=A0A1I7XXE9_9BILA
MPIGHRCHNHVAKRCVLLRVISVEMRSEEPQNDQQSHRPTILERHRQCYQPPGEEEPLRASGKSAVRPLLLIPFLLQITHVLTISEAPITDERKVEGVSYMFVFALDNPQQDLLKNNLLESALNYIDDAIKGGGNVLVHWYVVTVSNLPDFDDSSEGGVSRSVTVVAAYLMRKFEWTADKAILFIQDLRIADPNSGFVGQLNMFRAMGCSPWLRSTATGTLDGVRRLDDKQAHRRKFKCRRCREPLFYDTNLMEHGPESRFGPTTSEEKCNFGYLITPMEWMKLRTNEEKVDIPSFPLAYLYHLDFVSELWREVGPVLGLGEAVPRRRAVSVQQAGDSLDPHTTIQSG